MTAVKLDIIQLNQSYTNDSSKYVELAGVIVINSSHSSLQRIEVTAYGKVNIKVSPQNQSYIGRLYNNGLENMHLAEATTQVLSAGLILEEKMELPFCITLTPDVSRILYATYHGKYITIIYEVECSLTQCGTTYNLKKEFFVKSKLFKTDLEKGSKSEPVDFILDFFITDHKKAGSRSSNPSKFLLTGVIDANEVSISKPLTGQLTVIYSEMEIKSVDIVLLALETCSRGYKEDVSVIQVTQIIDGNVPAGLALPIYILFPPHLTCPTVITDNFKIEFAVKIVVMLKNFGTVSKTIPVKLTQVC